MQDGVQDDVQDGAERKVRGSTRAAAGPVAAGRVALGRVVAGRVAEGRGFGAGAIGRLRLGGLALAGLLALAACSQREEILPGPRENLRPEAGAAAEAPGSRPFRMPRAVVTAEWTHPGGNVRHHLEHVALGRGDGGRAEAAGGAVAAPWLALVWSADIGAGNDRRHRITAAPVVAGGRVFTLDSRATVTATSVTGARLWQVDLTPPTESPDEASGGGLAVAGDTVFVTTGFGRLVALDVASGARRWVQELEAPVTGAPTVHEGLVYVATRDSRAVAVRASDGRVIWQLPGIDSVTGVAGGASPAVAGDRVVFPFPSGELVATLRLGGVRLWGSVVTGRRKGRAYANVSDIAADPVIAGDTVYVGNASGRAVALDLASGERLWTARAGTLDPVWVADGSVFMVTDLAQLVRLDADSGAVVWSTELPYFRDARPKRRESVVAHWGPVLAGGRLLVVSSDGRLRSFAPQDGRLIETVALPAPAAAGVAIAGRTLYVVTADGRLHAYR